MSYFSQAPTKYLTKKGGFNLTHSFKALSITVGRSPLQEVASHAAPTVREQRGTLMLSVRLLLFIQYETPGLRDGTTSTEEGDAIIDTPQNVFLQ